MSGLKERRRRSAGVCGTTGSVEPDAEREAQGAGQSAQFEADSDGKILVVEDDSDMREVMEFMLEQLGRGVVLAGSVEEAATGIRIIKAFGRGPLLGSSFADEAASLRETGMATVAVGASLASVNRATDLWVDAGLPKKSIQHPLLPAC